ncbi:hypothetical protein M758_UG156300 [Ceratodon purpureus]|nr:hypothetical protein M758_UG156300 [Ceratodon purpureus]
MSLCTSSPLVLFSSALLSFVASKQCRLLFINILCSELSPGLSISFPLISLPSFSLTCTELVPPVTVGDCTEADDPPTEAMFATTPISPSLTASLISRPKLLGRATFLP